VTGSFSGNTEETLSAYREAVIRGCRVVAMSSGGELTALAQEDLVPLVPIPPEVPVPRAALGYLAAGPIGVLDAMGVIPPAGEEIDRTARLMEGLADRLGPDRRSESNPAKSLALWLAGKTAVVWGSEGLAEAPALRWKAELNENAKVPAFSAILPELDHNEVEGWSPGTGSGYALVVLRHRMEHPRVAERVAATLDALGGSGLEARQVHAEGSSPLEQLFSLVMMGDFTATYLGIVRGVDPTPIPVLSALKERLRT
jgi:glucose/mannose-6-phosphate isomerase